MNWRGDARMRFTKKKKIVFVCLATFGIMVIVFIANTIDANRIPITENNVRSQLEHMYDAEVAEVKKNEDVYEAIIAKSGQVYLVEMNAATGDVNSLEHTDDFIIEEVPSIQKEITDKVVDDSPAKTPSTEDKVKSKKKSSTGTSKLVVSEKPKESSEKVKVVEKPKDTENKSKKGTSSKKEEKVEEKPIKKVIKNAIKDVLNKEENKTETASKEKKKVEVKKDEIAKAEVSKATIESDSIKLEPEKIEALTSEPAKVDAPKTETADVPKSEESISSKETISIKTEEKSEDVEKNATVLITPEEATKLALASQKGVIESNTFVRTNEGGYYLVVMAIESSKEKKSKATVQVHAISGKVLSITWE